MFSSICLPATATCRGTHPWPNVCEATQVSELCRGTHLNAIADDQGHRRQGCYAAGDVTILTPYTGQLLIIKAELASFTESFTVPATLEASAGLRQAADRGQAAEPVKAWQTKRLSDLVQLKTVDNFQGEQVHSTSACTVLHDGPQAAQAYC